MTFLEKMEAAARAHRSLLCVGLDPDPSRLPVRDVARFLRAIVEATWELVCAYKPNLAFYEALGREGLRALEATLKAIPPHIPVIGDGKRGDIGNTARAYARALFEGWGFDAVTVNPYLGQDSLEPFLSYRDRGVFVLCRTSNPGAREMQELPVRTGEGEMPLYEWVAHRAREWDRWGNVGLVVGATHPGELARGRQICPRMPLLIPGVGAQGGDLEAAVRLGADAEGRRAIINASRAVLYASPHPRRYAREARQAALSLREAINRVLEEEGKGWS